MARHFSSLAEYNRSVPSTLRVPDSQAAQSQINYYRPKVSKEECELLLRGKSLGTFIARDSSTFVGGFCVMMRLVENSATVTRSYLLEKVGDGVHLRLTDEKSYPTLYDFIYAHTLDKMVLPGRLVLPSEDWMSKVDPALASKITIDGCGGPPQSQSNRKSGKVAPPLPPKVPSTDDEPPALPRVSVTRQPTKLDSGSPKPNPGPPLPPKAADPTSAKPPLPPLPPKGQEPLVVVRQEPPPVVRQEPPPVVRQDPPLPARQDPPLPARQDPPLPARQDPPLPARQDPPLPARQEPPLPARPQLPPKSPDPQTMPSQPQATSRRTSTKSEVEVDEVECELYYFGCMDTWADSHIECIFQTYLELVEIRSVAPNKVVFKMAGQSIHIEDKGDKNSKQFIRRHYPIRSILLFDLDPDQRTCKVKKEKKPLSVFGMVIRKPGQDKNLCHLFAAQHVAASGVIDAVQAAIDLFKEV